MIGLSVRILGNSSESLVVSGDTDKGGKKYLDDRQIYLQNKIVYLEQVATGLKNQLTEHHGLAESVL